VIELGIVVTIDFAAPLGEERPHVRETVRADVGNVQVETAIAPRRHPRKPATVRREPRLDVDGAVAGQAPLAAAREIEEPELDRLSIVAAEDDRARVGRNVRLVVIGALRMRELSRLLRADRLPPQ
jgi:hypothetical protein